MSDSDTWATIVGNLHVTYIFLQFMYKSINFETCARGPFSDLTGFDIDNTLLSAKERFCAING